MEGYLLKWINFIKGWSKKYFILSKHILYYSNQKGDSEKSAINLNIAKLIPEKNKTSFIIETGSNKIYLKASSEKERDNWIKLIRKEIANPHHLVTSFKNENLLIPQDSLNDKTQANVDKEEIFSQEFLKIDENFLEKNEKIDEKSSKDKPLINYDSRYFEDYNKLIMNKIDDMSKLIQSFQSSYFQFSEGLENINFALMHNKTKVAKDEVTKIHLELINVKKEFKVLIN